MTTKSIVIGVALGLVMTVTVGRVAASETQHHGTIKTPYRGTISGTVTSTQIDAIHPGDGAKGVLGIFAVTTHNLGQVTAQALVEDIPASRPSGTCPEGTDAEFTLGTVRSAHRFPNGDLLFLNALTRTACIDFDTLTVNIHETGEFNGGTGQFAQATGSWKITGTAELWVIDPAVQFFGPFSGKLRGTIVTPVPIRMAPNDD
jgi:hypothetical protein